MPGVVGVGFFMKWSWEREHMPGSPLDSSWRAAPPAPAAKSPGGREQEDGGGASPPHRPSMVAMLAGQMGGGVSAGGKARLHMTKEEKARREKFIVDVQDYLWSRAQETHFTATVDEAFFRTAVRHHLEKNRWDHFERGGNFGRK